MQWKTISKLIFLISLFVCSSFTYAIESTSLKEYKLAEQEDKITITFSFDAPVKYHCLILNNPERLVVDLENVSLKTKIAATNSDFIKDLRCSDHDHQYLRVVFDLKQKMKHTASFSKSNSELTINLAPKEVNDKEKPKPTSAKPKELDPLLDNLEENLDHPKIEDEPSKVSKKLALPPEPSLQLEPQNKRKNIVVVIDPGHGGKDPGAAGLHGAVEKEVVLKISKQLQNMLNDEPGFTAVLTRTTDYYIPLRKRLSIARKNKADMFIAIHADAYHHSHAAGASVYALSPRGATSEAARWLAEKENESELGGLSNELADKDAILRSVLIDLSQTHTIESSLQIGNTVLNKLGKFATLHHPSVEQAAFVVLKSPDIPSILIETGFLSNPEEEEKLTNADYQHQTAYAIKEGIKQYFIANSVGTWFSDNQNQPKEIRNLSEKTANAAKSRKKHKKLISRSSTTIHEG